MKTEGYFTSTLTHFEHLKTNMNVNNIDRIKEYRGICLKLTKWTSTNGRSNSVVIDNTVNVKIHMSVLLVFDTFLRDTIQENACSK